MLVYNSFNCLKKIFPKITMWKLFSLQLKIFTWFINLFKQKLESSDKIDQRRSEKVRKLNVSLIMITISFKFE